MNNYHPITLVPAMSKVPEIVVTDQLVSFLDKHNILSNLQFESEK